MTAAIDPLSDLVVLIFRKAEFCLFEYGYVLRIKIRRIVGVCAHVRFPSFWRRNVAPIRLVEIWRENRPKNPIGKWDN